MFEVYRFPPYYLTFWHIGARLGVGPVRRFLRRMIRSGHCRLLDVGSGAGSNSLLAALAGMSAVSCDRSPASLDETRRIASALNTISRNRMTLGDSCRLPFRNGAFDVVVASHIIEHLDDPSAMLHEIDRVLRPGGVLRISCPTTTHGMRVCRWLGLHVDPDDHKVDGYDVDALAALLPPGMRVKRVTYQGRFFESNLADAQHLLSRRLGLRANPVEDRMSPAVHRPPASSLRLIWILKEFVLLPAIALCCLEDVICFSLRGSMISVEVEKA
ncbi:MAG: methyltransferase domain-containing protein [Candidatus Hydrogenedentes bacterium]|nr:methyltransferase domain-containing protein [Candidatus Hydrogenedentota bacterium]